MGFVYLFSAAPHRPFNQSGTTLASPLKPDRATVKDWAFSYISELSHSFSKCAMVDGTISARVAYGALFCLPSLLLLVDRRHSRREGIIRFVNYCDSKSKYAIFDITCHRDAHIFNSSTCHTKIERAKELTLYPVGVLGASEDCGVAFSWVERSYGGILRVFPLQC